MKRFVLWLGMIMLTIPVFSRSAEPVGRPSRDPELDVLPGFRNPPAGYGEVPFYWWMGDTLTRDHLRDHLDLLKDHGISSLQVNYAHSDKGGKLWGLTFRSRPAIFTDAWWELFGWFMHEARERGMTVSLSDYTLGVGQQQYVDEILSDHPDMIGKELHLAKHYVKNRLQLKIPGQTLTVQAFRYDRDSLPIVSSQIDLTPQCPDGVLSWEAPPGEWLVLAVYASPRDPSYDPMHPQSGKRYVEYFFQRFEEHFPEEADRGLNFFFSDELNFQLGNLIWNATFRQEFIRRKGYDIVPFLPALFVDMGDRTTKYRLDYNDVMVSLCEERFFEPVYRWHEERGLIYGCDHGGRGLDVTEFGDYFRTQRWNQGPGCDQPRLGRDIIKNKVASSIAHLYNRPRVWLEGFYGSGWGTSSGDLTDAIFANFAQGQNLLSLHGLYYSTPGGWWEWAPPCNHFRMPYWAEMKRLLACTQRLSYLLSQGYHRADVALLYPVEPVAAGFGKGSVDCAFELGRQLYAMGIDFDFMDYESLARAGIEQGRLQVSGESFRVLIVPAMEAMRSTSLEKAVAFQQAGGIVIWVNRLPEATEQGRNDAQMQRLTAGLQTIPQQQVAETVSRAVTRDFAIVQGSVDQPYVLHRTAGWRDLYAVYNVGRGSVCYFRCRGGAELWDPWTGEVQTLPVLQTDAEGSYIRMPLEKTEMQLVVFDPRKQAEFETSVPAVQDSIVGRPISGMWETELIPVLDNRWGDFHWPATPTRIGAEIRRMEYAVRVADDWKSSRSPSPDWTPQSLGFGDYMVQLEALAQPVDESDLLLHPERLPWKPYAFSWRWGVENDYGHQGYHGLKAEMYAEFIRLGCLKEEPTQLSRVEDPRGKHYYLLTDVIAPRTGRYEVLCGSRRPTDVWINGQWVQLHETGNSISLKAGHYRVILHYDGAVTTYFLFRDPERSGQFVEETLAERPLSMPWNGDLSLLPYCAPTHSSRQYYRFVSAPGVEGLSFSAYTSRVKVWFDGKQARVERGAVRDDGLTVFEVRMKGRRTKAPVLVTMALESDRPGGAVFPEPIRQQCGSGEMEPGDWSRQPGLQCYSGGMWYRKQIRLDAEECARAEIIDLGRVVSTAELFVNGTSAGVRMAAPWRFDVSGLLHPGVNRLEIRVYNTAAPHYVSIPTLYRGETTSGLLEEPVLLLRP